MAKLPVFTPKQPRPVSSVEQTREFWRVTRVARFLDVSTKRVYQLVQEGRLEAIRLGPRQTRIGCASLYRYLEQLRIQAQDDLQIM